MFGQRNARSTLDHINLGFFSHAVLKELTEFDVEKPPRRPGSHPSLLHAIKSVSALPGMSDEPKKLGDARGCAFRRYEEYCALRRVFEKNLEGLSDSEHLLSTLRKITTHKDETNRHEFIKKATAFFTALAEEAVSGAQMSEEAALGSSRFSS